MSPSRPVIFAAALIFQSVDCLQWHTTPTWNVGGADTVTLSRVEDIVRQTRPAAWPQRWAGHPADCSMGPEVVDNPACTGKLQQAFAAPPTLSLMLSRTPFPTVPKAFAISRRIRGRLGADHATHTIESSADLQHRSPAAAVPVSPRLTTLSGGKVLTFRVTPASTGSAWFLRLVVRAR